MGKLASLKITLLGMILLALGAALSYGNPVTTPVWVLVAPLVVLALNLFAAILSNPKINRQSGLLVFHVGLLGIVILVAIGRLTYLDAHIEMIQGQDFSPDKLMEVKEGLLHGGNLQGVDFRQGGYTVQYAAGMQRGLTYSQVLIPDGRGNLEEKLVGDDRPLVLEAYRFYTTFNKGFTVLLTWKPNQGPAVSGTVNMPSYPLFDYKQDNAWTPPGGQEIKFWLQLDTGITEKEAWVLDGRNSSGILVVTTDEQRVELNPGQELALPGGRLRYDRLLTWMGYAVFYDPTIKWLFYISMLCVMGLGWHYWQKMGSRFLPAEKELLSEAEIESKRRR